MHIYGLVDADIGYRTLKRSQLLPRLDVALLASYVDRPSQTQAVKAYRQALRAQQLA